MRLTILFHADRVGKTKDYHPVARELLDYPPKGIEFIESKFKRSLVNRFYTHFNIKTFPAIRKLPEDEGYDLIFSTGFAIENEKPWISWDEALHPTFYTNIMLFRKLYLSEYCKKILT